MTKTNKSIEEIVEDWAKLQFGKEHYFTKTASMNPEIDAALSKAPSKQGGSGSNYPDIRCMLESGSRRIPVMIEVKGTRGELIKMDTGGQVENTNAKGEPHYKNIAKYAVNGAVHYARAILDYSETYKEVLAIGINGFEQNDGKGTVEYEVDYWYISKDNLLIPKRVGDFSDLSYLLKSNQPLLLEKIDSLKLSEAEVEERKRHLENKIERALKKLNQDLHDVQDIVVNNRVQLVAGMIMAGLGTSGVPPLRVDELRGENSEDNDGAVIMSKIRHFLTAKNIPQEKIEMITGVLGVVFLQSDLQIPVDGESKLHTIYSQVKDDILPYLTGELHNLDFTGRLFNVMNEWVSVPDGDKNDVVLTPRYVTELMAKLCCVNKDSYVWDFATGSGGFLISAMNEMIADAKKTIKSQRQIEDKITAIKMNQLLGIEKLPDVYMLAVLNMILMKDGSANIIKGDSLQYDGRYQQGAKNGKEFPATVFLLNPPYSADGKGFVFVERALSMMSHGKRAAILIQENAGSGNGMPYTQRILEHNTLLASIKMADIFCGKASVQTAIYVFEIGRPHNILEKVRFIDFSEDGYTRMNRKKSGQDVNLRDTDHAKERYEEVKNLVLYGKDYIHYYRDCFTEECITLSGKDWTYGQHRKIDTVPTEEDFQNVVREYLSWKVGQVLKGEGCLGKR